MFSESSVSFKCSNLLTQAKLNLSWVPLWCISKWLLTPFECLEDLYSAHSTVLLEICSDPVNIAFAYCIINNVDLNNVKQDLTGCRSLVGVEFGAKAKQSMFLSRRHEFWKCSLINEIFIFKTHAHIHNSDKACRPENTVCTVYLRYISPLYLPTAISILFFTMILSSIFQLQLIVTYLTSLCKTTSRVYALRNYMFALLTPLRFWSACGYYWADIIFTFTLCHVKNWMESFLMNLVKHNVNCV